MKTRPLGKTRLEVSELCMGCWQIGGLFWGSMDVKDAQCLLKPPTNWPMSTAVVRH
mgnify:CR=1 FL=1